MADTDVDLGALEGFASQLRNASTVLESSTEPPEPPEAGDATGILAAVLSHVTLSMDGAVTGLGAVGDAVMTGRELFEQNEDDTRNSLPTPK